ncbi:MAG: ribosome biogenesis GTP-binding protein YihA/YsxC [Bacilli bacterium]|nr:ribosome biogenesis GTP-binding protein YihA/YsxC [Bacilli bacterium]
MINFKNATFVKSAPNVDERPPASLPEVLIVGKSNVGKSSLINVLTNKKSLAFTSKKPGHTKLLNYYDIDQKFYLVDAPGYGYAVGGLDLDRLFGKMMDEYFQKATQLKLVLLLLDSRRTFKDNDLEILSYLRQYNIPFFVVVTKMDKINQKEKAALNRHLQEMNITEGIYFTSSNIVRSLESLKNGIENKLK